MLGFDLKKHDESVGDTPLSSMSIHNEETSAKKEYGLFETPGASSTSLEPAFDSLSEHPYHGLEVTIDSVLPSYGGKKWYQLHHIQQLCWVLFIVSLTASNNGYDGSLLNSLYTMPDFNNAIGNVSGSIMGALSNGYVFGLLISFLASARINDAMGRKYALIIGNAIMIGGVIIQSCSGTWAKNLPEHYEKRDIMGMLTAGRIVLGIGSGIIQVAAPSLISELSFPTHREVVTTMYNASWYLGAIVAAWVSFGTKGLKNHWNWRIPVILQCMFAVIQLILVPFFVPESPRWLISKNRMDEAKNVLDKYHGGGYEGAETLIDYEMTEIQLAIEKERAANATSSYRDFIKTKANMKRLWIFTWVGIFVQLSGNGLVSYYLGKVLTSIGYTQTSEQLIINGCLMIFNYGSCIIQSVGIVPYIKRRQVFGMSFTGMIFCYVIWTVLSAINQERHFEDKGLGKGVLAMIFLYYFFYNLGLNGMSITYVTEILPFTLRAKGFNLYLTVLNLGSIFSGFVNPVAMDAIDWKYYIVYDCILVVECCVYYFTFVETSGRTLEEVAEVFGDGIEDLSKVSGIAALEDGKLKPDYEVEHEEYA
ncbi:Lactose permease [Hanseniaspora osmophila]|uniref:Lactose permease n=1 Tax=Hanseniaspora osmophila TaxID=56408 RepID=A0A1E5RAZ0_9ASCO|nr:Lactose permease [Hanseniaspora osmophila]